MHSLILSTLLAFSASAPNASDTPAAPAALDIQPDSTDVSEAFQYGIAEAHYTVRNSGTRPITITRIAPRKGRGEGTVDPSTIAPGGTAKLTLRRALDRLGYADYVFTATTDDKASPSYRIVMPAFAQSAYSPEGMQIGFENIKKGVVKTESFSVESYETPDLRLRAVIEAPPWLQIREVPRAPGTSTQRLTIEATVRPEAVVGFHQGVVRLATTVESQPDLVIGAYAKVFDDVVAKPMPLNFGAVHLGKSQTRSVEFRSNDGRALELDTMAADGKHTKLASAACGADCVRIDVTLSPTERGMIAGVMRAQFKGRKSPVDVPYSGLFVKASTKIEDLGTLGEDAMERYSGEEGGEE